MNSPLSKHHMVRAGTLLLCLCCGACLAMQEQIDANTRDVSRLQATTHNDLAQLRGEIQTLSGNLEENNVVLERKIADINKRLDTITAMLKGPALEMDDTATLPAGQTGPSSSAQTHYEQALQLYRERDYKRSQASFEAFLKQSPESPLAQNAHFWTGMSLFQQSKYRESIAAFEDLIKKFPQGNKVPDAYYWQAMSFIQLQEMLTAQILLETLMQTYPTSEASKKAQKKYDELTSGTANP